MVGAYAADANNGIPFRPSPMDTAGILWCWGPRTDSPEDLDLPLAASYSITPLDV